MSEYLDKVKDFLSDLDYVITGEDPAEELVVIENEERGIKHCILDCEAPILIIEQMIFPNPGGEKLYERLLQMNRSLVHGAFVLDNEGKNILWRDTLEIENLDKNELEGSLQALMLGLSEFGHELLEFTKK